VDGSFDSIFLTCFATIKTAQTEYELFGEPEGRRTKIQQPNLER
jgi:hypothetical protein